MPRLKVIVERMNTRRCFIAYNATSHREAVEQTIIRGEGGHKEAVKAIELIHEEDNNKVFKGKISGTTNKRVAIMVVDKVAEGKYIVALV